MPPPAPNQALVVGGDKAQPWDLGGEELLGGGRCGDEGGIASGDPGGMDRLHDAPVSGHHVPDTGAHRPRMLSETASNAPGTSE